MSGEAVAQLPVETLKLLYGLAEKAGVELPQIPGVVQFAATIDVTKPIRVLAMQLGQVVKGQDIFLKSDRIVTVDEETGEIRPMTPTRFVGWVEDHCAFSSSGRSQRLRDSLTREDATIVLDQDIFRSQLRQLRAVNQMRLPVRRATGVLEFLPVGYDAESQIYTVETIKYDMDWSLERSTEWLVEHGEGYPWNWQNDEGERDLRSNRSWCVHVAAMLGVYCKEVFPPGIRRPMITYIANQVGSGKSTLVAQALYPVFGNADNTAIPKDDDKMNQELNTVAINRRPYLFFDDIGGGIFSHPLNAFITATGRAGRILGGDEDFREKLQTQVFATGNDIKISADLMRRSLIAELFMAGEMRGRKFKRTISIEYLAQESTRASFLSAMCAIVKNYMMWVEKHKAANVDLPEVRGLESFEQWTAMVSAMVQAAGLGDPLVPPDLSAGGSEDEDEMKELLIKVATANDGDAEFDRKELVEYARGFGLLEPLVGATGDKDLDPTSMKKWGRQLQKWRGRELVDERGRRFRFSHKRQKRGAKYPMTFIRPKEAAVGATPASA